MKKLLLLLAPYSNSSKDVIAATLAWMVKELGLNFEVYYEAYRSGKHFSHAHEDYFGSTVLGGFHHERFYFLNKLFNIEYVVYGQPEFLSRSLLENISGKIIVETDDLFDLYQKVFSYYDIEYPKESLIVETRPFRGKDLTTPRIEYSHRWYKKLYKKPRARIFSKTEKSVRNLIDLSPYCYPEIFFRRALGIGSTFSFGRLSESYESNHLSSIHTLFINEHKVNDLKNQGFNVGVIDKFEPSDTYWSVTSRIAKRWLNHSDGVAFCDPVLASYWLPWLCRHKRLAVYEVFMKDVRNQVKDLILTTRNKIVCGRQSADQDITELSKHDITFQIMDPGRPLFPVIEEAKYRMRQPKESYYEFEPDEDLLISFANKRKILCTLLFYCPDIRHAEGLPQILELATLTKIKMGLAITAQSYKLVPEILEMINVPIENGGVFPNVEPLLCSAGMGVSVEADGFLKRKTLRKHLEKARQIISEIAGARCLPKGHYPFLDTIKDYPYSKSVLKCTDNAEPPFETIEESGFEYSISYASPGKPRVLRRSDTFIAINHTSKDWHPYSPFLVTSNPREIKIIELRLALTRKPGWIILAFDSPLWLFPYYLWKKGNKLLNVASYILRGGITGKLINTTPHVISRYARVLDEQGLL